MNLSIVVPARDEENNVVYLHQALSQVLQGAALDYEIIFVDDGSHDQTVDQLKSLHAQDPRVKIIKFRSNFGKSAALTAGFSQSRGEMVITMDADLQEGPDDLLELVQEMRNGYDVVSGWRHSRKDPLSKRIFSRVYNWLTRKLTRVSIHDMNCGFKAYKSGCVRGLELRGGLHRYIPALLSRKGYKVGELKVTHRPRVRGKTKYGWSRLARGFFDLLLVSIWLRLPFNSVPFFFGGGRENYVIEEIIE
jgi:glycosyltransferase involved in cell wall biosynthesis